MKPSGVAGRDIRGEGVEFGTGDGSTLPAAAGGACFWNASSWALRPGERVAARTVARTATPIDWTTCRVALLRAEPRAVCCGGTTESAVTSVVWIVMPSAAPRNASRKRIQRIDVSAWSSPSCQVLIASRPKPITSSGRAPILS